METSLKNKIDQVISRADQNAATAREAFKSWTPEERESTMYAMMDIGIQEKGNAAMLFLVSVGMATVAQWYKETMTEEADR